MIGPLLASVTGRTSRPSFLKKPAPRATAVGSPVLQLGETSATVMTCSSAALAKLAEINSSEIANEQCFFHLNFTFYRQWLIQERSLTEFTLSIPKVFEMTAPYFDVIPSPSVGLREESFPRGIIKKPQLNHYLFTELRPISFFSRRSSDGEVPDHNSELIQ